MAVEGIRAAPAVAVPTGRRRSNREATVAFWLFVAPLLIGLIVFTFVPIVWGFLISLSRARNTVSLGEFIGFQNYVDVLRDGQFRRALVTILVFTAFIVPITYAVALGIAMLVNGAGWGRGFFRTAFFIPTAISYVVASLIWKMSLFSGIPSGVANIVLFEWFGYEDVVSWIVPRADDPPWFWLVLVTVRLWLQVGFYMIIFIAGLQEIPRSLYEAAYVDGARTGWRTFRDITLPMLRNTSIAVLLLLFINAFQAFDEFFNILGGTAATQGNRGLARPPLVYLYEVAFQDQNYGAGSAGAFILTAIIIGVTVVQGRLFGFGRSS
ncbi:MAG: sugar ABC transporter permease [Chloroflexota bacterium]|nr:sugar ABC transporter permease [Chloroflexota bacterium]